MKGKATTTTSKGTKKGKTHKYMLARTDKNKTANMSDNTT